MALRNVACTFVGDEGVGKTSCLLSYSTCMFPRGHLPSICERMTSNVMVDQEPTSYDLRDTGAETTDWDFELQNVDVVALCYDITRPNTLDSILEKWYPLVNKREPNAQFIVLGFKLDIARHLTANAQAIPLDRIVSSEAVERVKDLVGAYKAIQTSSLDHDANGCLNEVFREIVHVKYPIPTDDGKDRKKCTIQ